MFAWLKRIFDRSDDPVYSCDLYRDKDAGSCAHVDGPLCDFPKCSMLADYRRDHEGMTIKDDPQFRDDLRSMLPVMPPPRREDLEAAGHRLALELECLLMDTKDLPTVSCWWDTGMQALEEWRRMFPYSGPRLGD